MGGLDWIGFALVLDKAGVYQNAGGFHDGSFHFRLRGAGQATKSILDPHELFDFGGLLFHQSMKYEHLLKCVLLPSVAVLWTLAFVAIIW